MTSAGIDAALLAALPFPVAARDLEGRYVRVGAAYATLFGIDAAAAIGRTPLDVLPARIARRYAAEDAAVYRKGCAVHHEYLLGPPSAERAMLVHKFPLRDPGGRLIGVGTAVVDLGRLGNAAEALRDALVSDRDRFENSPIPMTEEDWSEAKRIVDGLRAGGVDDLLAHVRAHPESLAELAPAARILDANPAAVRVYRARSREALLDAFNAPPDLSSYNPTTGLSDIYVTLLDRMSKGETRIELEGPDTALDGTIIHIRTTTSIATGHAHDWGQVIQTVEDFTARERAEREVRRLAMTDPLTGLANRNRFESGLAEIVARARRKGERVALLVIDLDGFKPVNDRLGHAAGDAVLETVAGRLKDASRESDLVARIGGDEFACVIAMLEDRGAAARPAERIIESLSMPLHAAGETIAIGASVGIALFPDDAGDIDTLQRHADRALYAAKNAGKNRHRFYEGG